MPLDGGAENCSIMRPPGTPKVVPPDCPFDVLSGSWSGSARRLLIVSEVTGCVVNAQVSGAPETKATSPATASSILFIDPPFAELIVGFLLGLSSPNL